MAVVCSIGGLLFLPLALIDSIADAAHMKANTFIRIVLLGASVIFISVAVRLHFIEKGRIAEAKIPSPHRPSVAQLSLEQLEFLMSDKEDLPRSLAFANLVVALRGRTQHVTERFVLEYPVFTRHVSQDFRITDALLEVIRVAKTVPFPIYIAKKGGLVDDLTVELSIGKTQGITPYEEILRLQLLLLRHLFSDAFGAAWVADHQTARGFTDAVDAIALFGDSKKPIEETIASARHEFQLAFPEQNVDASAKLSTLVEFIRTYATAYPVCVEITGADLTNRFSITYSHRGRLEEVWDGTMRWIRRALSVTPFSYRFRLVMPFTAKSYHLLVQGPSGTYSYSQEMYNEKGERLQPEHIHGKPSEGLPGYVRRRARRPYHLAHLYIRGLRDVPRYPLYVVTRFDETPPGSMGTVALLSLLLALLMPGIAFMAEHTTSPSAFNLLALLLAVPGLAAILGGSGKLGDAPIPSLTARAGFLAVAILSGASILMFTGVASGSLPVIINQQGIFDLIIPIRSLYWQILIIAAIANALYLIGIMRKRTGTYRDLSRMSESTAADEVTAPGKPLRGPVLGQEPTRSDAQPEKPGEAPVSRPPEPAEVAVKSDANKEGPAVDATGPEPAES
jgi:hypothetical protein